MFELQNVDHGWLWIIGLLAGAAVLFGVYYSIYQRTERRLAWLLLGLRAAGLVALVLALARPVWTKDEVLTDAGRLAVVLDTSRSMSLADRGGESRYRRALAAIEDLKSQLDAQDDVPAVELALFDINGEPLELDNPPDEPIHEVTDLERAVGRVQSRLRSRLLIGVVLVSDGMDNTGREQVVQLGDAAVPLHAIGFRSDPSAAELDLAVGEPETSDDQVLVNNQVSVRVPISREAGDNKHISVTVRIRRAGRDIVQKKISLEPGRKQTEVSLSFTPTEPGSFVYTATVTSDTAGEQQLGNNRRHFPLTVNSDAIGVLYLEGFLRFEHAFLRKRLDDDPDVSLVTVVRSANPNRPGVAADSLLLTPGVLEDIDLVILGDMEGGYLADEEYSALTRWVGEEGHALMVLGGYRSFGPSGFRKRHPIFKLGDDSVAGSLRWDTAPQLAGCCRVKEAKAAAEVLAVNRGLNVDGKPAVVVATGRYGQGHTMVITADTTWRWSRIPRLRGQTDELYARFWSQAVRWLTGHDDDQATRITVSTNKPSYDVGQPVSIRVAERAVVGTATGPKPSVQVVHRSGTREVGLHPAPDGSGDWIGTFPTTATGPHEVLATLSVEQNVVANQRTDFLVHGPDLETADARANPKLLQKITEERGAGVYLDIDQAGDLAKRIKPDRAERRMRRENQPTEYWNSPFLFMFFLVAVSSEWWIRRRNRLV